ncbi:hypothetical protein FHG87_023858 [Trinorchestia longiramus]|nr:hypothetical protein FHG87_023858 [Trinorchestia longiramus]
MESNQNTEKASKAQTRYCKECKATYSLQLFNIRGCSMEECLFFNIEKCLVMHVGANNRHFQHTMYDIPIETVQQHRDLGVIVTKNLKHDIQVEKASKMQAGISVSLHETLNTSQRT